MPIIYTPPGPPNGVVFTPATDTNAQAALFFGEDIWFDVAAGLGANYIVTPAGDWLPVTGMDALRQSLLRRTITTPGEWRTKPGYGVGLLAYVKAKDSPAMRSELAARIKSQYLEDRRVESVDQVVIEKLTDPAGLRVNVQFTPRGRLRTDAPAALLIEIR